MLSMAILAGGLATRMRPLTEHLPKSLIPVCGKPFIFYQLQLLQICGIKHVVICTGYLGEMIENILKNVNFDIDIKFSNDGEKLLGTGGAIKKALHLLPDKFMIIYGDSWLNVNYKKIADTFQKSNFKALMTIYKNNNKLDKSNIYFEKGHILKYDKNNTDNNMIYIDYGLSCLTKQVFNNTPDSFDIADLFSKLSKENYLEGIEIYERFYEIGSNRGLKEFEQFVLNREQLM